MQRSLPHPRGPRAVVTVVPAQNEEQLIPACLTSIRRAAECVPLPVITIVVLDSCTDGSARTAAAADRTVTVDRRNVGADPIWLWHWAFPGDSAVPWDRARTFPLTRHRRRAKQAAVAEFATQIVDLSDDPADRAVLPPHVLARLTRDHETVFVP